MKKMYSVKELSIILGCSPTAVNKKIKQVDDNPEIRLYKNRYEVVINEGKTVILLDDEELEKEKELSKGFNKVINNGYNDNTNVVETVENSYIQAETQQIKDNSIDKILEFSNGYLNRYETLQREFYEEMRNKDKQILLLTTSENQKQSEYIETQAKNKTLETQNKRLMLYLTVVTTLFITVVLMFIFYNLSS